MPIEHIVDQAIEQVKNLPDSIAWLGAIPSAALGLIAWRSLHKDRESVEKKRAQVGLNANTNGPVFEHLSEKISDNQQQEISEQNPQIESLIIESGSENPATTKFFESRKKLTSRKLMAVGAVGLAASIFMHPTFRESTPSPTGMVEVALDSSYPNTLTNDISQPTNQHPASTVMRFNSAVQGLAQSNYKGDVGVTEFANTSQTAITLGPDSQSSLANIKELPLSDQNGDCLVSAIQSAVPSQYGGELLIVSSGVNVDAACADTVTTTLTSEAATLQKENVKVKVVVPGTTTGNADYTVQGAGPYPSQVSPETFNVFGSQNVTVASSSDALATAIQTDEAMAVPKKGKTVTTETYIPPYLIAAGIGIAGYARDRKRVRKVTLSN